jgi:hypothetical protein
MSGPASLVVRVVVVDEASLQASWKDDCCGTTIRNNHRRFPCRFMSCFTPTEGDRRRHPLNGRQGGPGVPPAQRLYSRNPPCTSLFLRTPSMADRFERPQAFPRQQADDAFVILLGDSFKHGSSRRQRRGVKGPQGFHRTIRCSVASFFWFDTTKRDAKGKVFRRLARFLYRRKHHCHSANRAQRVIPQLEEGMTTMTRRRESGRAKLLIGRHGNFVHNGPLERRAWYLR